MNRLNLLFPFGIFPGDTLDPAQLAAELQEASRVAGSLGQQNWTRDGLTLDLFAPECVQMESKETGALLNLLTGGATAPVLPDVGGADANLWKIPYNQGYTPVGTGLGGGAMTVSWTSDVVELVLLIGTCQYDRTIGSGSTPRAQIALELDGTVLDGTASQGDPPWGQVRGSGMNQQDAAWSGVYPMLLLPGSHTLSLVAGQALATAVSLVDGTEDADSLATQILERVCVGSRAVYAIRVAMGGVL